MGRVNNVGGYLQYNKLVWRRRLSVGPERLSDAIATKEGLSHWFMPTKFEIAEGCPFSFGGGWEGTISEVEPHNHIQFDKDGDDGGYLRCRMEVDNGGCLFSLIDRMGEGVDANEIFASDTPSHRLYQPGGPGTHWSGVAAGYHGFVDSLEGHITSKRINLDYDELCKRYLDVLDDYFGHGAV